MVVDWVSWYFVKDSFLEYLNLVLNDKELPLSIEDEIDEIESDNNNYATYCNIINSDYIVEKALKNAWHWKTAINAGVVNNNNIISRMKNKCYSGQGVDFKPARFQVSTLRSSY